MIEPLVAKPLAIKRVLTNLIDNAVKYGQSAEVDIPAVIKVRVIVTIQDHGSIPEDKMEAGFEPYFRLATDKSRTRFGAFKDLSETFCMDTAESHYSQLLSKAA